MGSEVKRLLVNDMLSALPDHRTFWHDLRDWFGMEFWGLESCGQCDDLGRCVRRELDRRALAKEDLPSLVIRNASYFRPFDSYDAPVISLLQDIMPEGPGRTMQNAVLLSSRRTVFNSAFAKSQYEMNRQELDDFVAKGGSTAWCVIPLPVDFKTFEPGNAMGLQQALSLPPGAVCWVGACMNSTGLVKGYDILLSIARLNPDIPFVCVFKDGIPDSLPPNIRAYLKLSQSDLAQVMGACRIGLCTSRSETQHLAGIEMGACGLPMVAPPVGVYAGRENMPGIVVADTSIGSYTAAIRAARQGTEIPESVRAYWMKEHHPEIVRLQWAALIASVEKK